MMFEGSLITARVTPEAGSDSRIARTDDTSQSPFGVGPRASSNVAQSKAGRSSIASSIRERQS